MSNEIKQLAKALGAEDDPTLEDAMLKTEYAVWEIDHAKLKVERKLEEDEAERDLAVAITGNIRKVCTFIREIVPKPDEKPGDEITAMIREEIKSIVKTDAAKLDYSYCFVSKGGEPITASDAIDLRRKNNGQLTYYWGLKSQQIEELHILSRSDMKDIPAEKGIFILIDDMEEYFGKKSQQASTSYVETEEMILEDMQMERKNDNTIRINSGEKNPRNRKRKIQILQYLLDLVKEREKRSTESKWTIATQVIENLAKTAGMIAERAYDIKIMEKKKVINELLVKADNEGAVEAVKEMMMRLVRAGYGSTHVSKGTYTWAKRP